MNDYYSALSIEFIIKYFEASWYLQIVLSNQFIKWINKHRFYMTLYLKLPRAFHIINYIIEIVYSDCITQ